MKYYVTSGDLYKDTDAEDPRSAALEAISSLEDDPVRRLSRITLVSTDGGHEAHDDDHVFLTLDLLEETGLLSAYKQTDWL